MLYKISAAGRAQSNVCRNLHRLIHREGLTLPVNIDLIQLPVRKRRPTVKKVMVWYPVIYPSTWIRFLLKEHSYLLLAGWSLEEVTSWQGCLDDFWQSYKRYDPDHIMNRADAPPSNCTVPLYVHGDEGRGKYKLPIMIEAFQPAISYKGKAFKNSSGYLV